MYIHLGKWRCPGHLKLELVAEVLREVFFVSTFGQKCEHLRILLLDKVARLLRGHLTSYFRTIILWVNAFNMSHSNSRVDVGSNA